MSVRLARLLVSSLATAAVPQEIGAHRAQLEAISGDVSELHDLLESCRSRGSITPEEYVSFQHQVWRLREAIEEKRKRAGLTGPSP
ncbi:hypothetical protein JXA12_01395 [Candidatus Woesearchaeota archaeon]|nr:hypothetical protein [Candidatus Woesearchaeota archaeon]